jgi:hypothetical protein
MVNQTQALSGGQGLPIFEWNTDSLLFPYMPPATWDMGLDSVWEAGQIVAAEARWRRKPRSCCF